MTRFDAEARVEGHIALRYWIFFQPSWLLIAMWLVTGHLYFSHIPSARRENGRDGKPLRLSAVNGM